MLGAPRERRETTTHPNVQRLLPLLDLALNALSTDLNPTDALESRNSDAKFSKNNPGLGRTDMLGFGLSSKPIRCSNAKRVSRPGEAGHRVSLLGTIAAGALCATLTDAAQAEPDPCTGTGTVTCSGNQSAGIANPPPGTSILNVNSLTSDIMPTNGQPGITFESSSDITLNSDTRPYVINSVARQFEIIPGIIVSNEPVGIFLSSAGAINLTSSGNMSVVGDFGVGI